MITSEFDWRERAVVVAADYPFLDVLWTLLVFFAWVAWFWLLITVAADVFRRDDIGGGKKAVWLVFMVFLPFIGVFAYLIANNDGMTRRNQERVQAARAQMDDYVRSVAGSDGGAASEIDKAKQLLDSGAITQAEFDAIKQKALAQ
jgi:Short C-terminal domain/Phospholipase_D-nuclease N-terminal